jgi:hypothetical protein
VLQGGHERCLLPCKARPVQTRKPGVQLHLHSGTATGYILRSLAALHNAGRYWTHAGIISGGC